MRCHYPHLLSPLKIGNIILKNRMLSSNALPHFMQGPENFPADPLITYCRHLAKNGAAIVSIGEWSNPMQRKLGCDDSRRMPSFDLSDPAVSNYLSHLVEDIHFYDSLASIVMMFPFPMGYVFSGHVKEYTNSELVAMGVDLKDPATNNMMTIIPFMAKGKEIPKEMIPEAIAAFIEKLKFYKSCGYDMCGLMCSSFLSPVTNHRTDEYGGSLENRARFPLELCAAIKRALGQDFLIELIMEGEEEEPEGYKIEDLTKFAKMGDGIFDILQVREANGALAHATTYNSKKGVKKTLEYCKIIKASGTRVRLAPIAGYQDLDENEAAIASGAADIIAMGRAFIADPEYGKKAYEGRGSDVTPCIRCNKCHGIMKGPWIDFCSVNPEMGLEHKLERMIEPVTRIKKVAVVGGGPAGMEAAFIAAKRGHKVTLFEKTDKLGGQLLHADFASFKWPVKDFKEYLIRMVNKYGVNVRMGIDATPEMIEAEGYDVVIAALGAVPKYPDIKGISEIKPLTAFEVYGREKELGKRVVIVGGSETGTETGMYLAECGHDVVVLTRQDRLAHDASPMHNITMADEKRTPSGLMHFTPAWALFPSLKWLTNVRTIEVGKNYVKYIDAGSKEQTIDADTVVVCGGMKALADKSLAFYGSAGRFYMIGDGNGTTNIQQAIRDAYAAAVQI